MDVDVKNKLIKIFCIEIICLLLDIFFFHICISSIIIFIIIPIIFNKKISVRYSFLVIFSLVVQIILTNVLGNIVNIILEKNIMEINNKVMNYKKQNGDYPEISYIKKDAKKLRYLTYDYDYIYINESKFNKPFIIFYKYNLQKQIFDIESQKFNESTWILD